MGFRERVDASIGDAVPKLDVAIFGTGGVKSAVEGVFDVGDGSLMLVRGVGTDEALERLHVVKSKRRVVGAGEQIIAGRMISQASQLRGLVHVLGGFFHGGFGEIEDLEMEKCSEYTMLVSCYNIYQMRDVMIENGDS